MKIVTIGDIHGNKEWKSIIDEHIDSSDKIIFLGDYLDPYLDIYIKEDIIKYSYKNLIINFLNIIRLKLRYPDKIELLIGNHDLHYLYSDVKKSSRYDYKNARKIKEYFNKYRELFKICYKYDNHIFTHAGISNKWIESNYEDLKIFGLDEKEIDTVLNDMLFDEEGREILNYIGKYRNTGGKTFDRNDVGGPLWADARETSYTYIDGYHQYVGHSRIKNIYKNGDDNSSITYCDCLIQKENNYLILNL